MQGGPSCWSWALRYPLKSYLWDYGLCDLQTSKPRWLGSSVRNCSAAGARAKRRLIPSASVERFAAPRIASTHLLTDYAKAHPQKHIPVISHGSPGAMRAFLLALNRPARRSASRTPLHLPPLIGQYPAPVRLIYPCCLLARHIHRNIGVAEVTGAPCSVEDRAAGQTQQAERRHPYEQRFHSCPLIF